MQRISPLRLKGAGLAVLHHHGGGLLRIQELSLALLARPPSASQSTYVMALRIEQESALYARVAVSLTQESPISGITTLAVVVESLFDAAALGASPVC